MQGRDKGLELYKGKALIEWVIAAVQPQVSEIIISANRNLEQYAKLGFPIVVDEPTLEARQGPIAGIYAALKSIKSAGAATVLVTPCDTPILPHDYVAKLANALASPAVDIAVVHDGKRRQNLHCLIKCSELSSLSEFYANGGRAMHRWLSERSSQDVDFSEQATAFKNFNSLSRAKL